MKSKKPEVVVITGASAGVGRAIARTFGKRGARIGLLARGEAGLEGARQDIIKLGGEAIAIPTDVANANEVEAGAIKTEEAFGPIDIWINDAMESVFAPFKDIDAETYKRVTEVTYLGYVYGTMSALRRMLPRNKGKIIQIGSALAYRSIPLQSAYCGAKHAIKGFTDSIRSELIHDHSDVTISMAQLPAVNTPQFEWVKSALPNHPQPVPPIYQPEVIADAVSWLVDHPQRELFIGLNTAIIITANKIFPGLGDLYLARTGYQSQQTAEPVAENRKDNIWKPVDETKDYQARGEFNDRAKQRTWRFRAHSQIASLALLGAMGIAGGFTLLRKFH